MARKQSAGAPCAAPEPRAQSAALRRMLAGGLAPAMSRAGGVYTAFGRRPGGARRGRPAGAHAAVDAKSARTSSVAVVGPSDPWVAFGFSVQSWRGRR